MHSFTPLPPPKSLKVLLWTTFAGALLSPLLFPYFALSLKGIENFYLWQLITPLFTAYPPLNFSFLMHIGFNLFLLWVFGAPLLETLKPKRFFSLYFLSAAFGLFLASLIMKWTPYPFPLAGNSMASFAVVFSWLFFNPQARFFLFFTVPLQGKWAVSLLLGLSLFSDLSSQHFPSMAATLGSVSFSYLFSLFTLKKEGPFLFLQPLERKILRLLDQGKSFHKKVKIKKHKVYDIKSGKPLLDDDIFIDEMLAKISKFGEASLTEEERKKMKEISKNQKAKNG